MSNTTLNFLLKDYEQKKYACELKFEKEKKDFYSSHPELSKIKSKLGNLSLDISKAIMRGDTDLAEKLKLESNALTSKKEDLLRSLKLPERCNRASI